MRTGTRDQAGGRFVQRRSPEHALAGWSPNPNVKDSTGGTPLMAACLSCQVDMVDALLAGKASHAAKDASGLTALHCAAMMGQVEISESLIKAARTSTPKIRTHVPRS